ncbi:MAG TPA: LegC family aminotransferase [Stellaceae bacterium]|nr:LegC family aminotransferase [Stellaceae bacterium]
MAQAKRQFQFDLDVTVAALRSVLPETCERVPLHQPVFAGKEWDYVKECLDSTVVSSIGSFVGRFERQMAELAGTRHAVAIVNGTAALHVALLLAGVRPGDEVLAPTLTFVATANAISYCGAVPHFIDSSLVTLGIDPDRLRDYLRDIAERRGDEVINRRTGRVIRALVPMHTFGHPVDMEPVLDVAAEWGLFVIEDATESLGSRYKGKPTGGWSRLAAFSFNGNKIVTTGGGGAITTDDEALAEKAKHLTTTAKLPHPWAFVHDAVGFNYRMPNLNAALGCAQLEQIHGFLASKRKLAERYRRALAGVPGASFVAEPPFARSNYWLNALLLDEQHADAREQLLERCNAAGLCCRPAWTLMHHLPIYRNCPRMELPVAESVARRLINLPSGAGLAEAGGG